MSMKFFVQLVAKNAEFVLVGKYCSIVKRNHDCQYIEPDFYSLQMRYTPSKLGWG